MCEEILNEARPKPPPSSQAAAALLETSRVSFPVCGPIDDLLGEDGLRPGHILELSGPPGAPKELCLLKLMNSILHSRNDVLCIGVENIHCEESTG